MRYSSNDSSYSVELRDEMVRHLVKHIKPAGRRETGGILIGWYNASRDCAIIEMVTAPPSDSKSGYSWFRRGVNGLQELISRAWKKNLYYLGEWHFHPYAPASPSRRDILQMEVIAASKQYNCPEPILLIIGGSPELYEIMVFVVAAEAELVVLI